MGSKVLCLGNVMTFYSILIIYDLNGSRIHILESRNGHAHSIDMLVACVNTLIALASESAMSFSMHFPRGQVDREGGMIDVIIPLNVCNNTKLCCEKDGCTLLQNRRCTKYVLFVPVSYLALSALLQVFGTKLCAIDRNYP